MSLSERLEVYFSALADFPLLRLGQGAFFSPYPRQLGSAENCYAFQWRGAKMGLRARETPQAQHYMVKRASSTHKFTGAPPECSQRRYRVAQKRSGPPLLLSYFGI